MSEDKIAEIQARHNAAEIDSIHCPGKAHDDRAWLLAEVVRQTQLIEALERIQRETVVARHRLAEGVSQASALRAEVERALERLEMAEDEGKKLRAESERLTRERDEALTEVERLRRVQREMLTEAMSQAGALRERLAAFADTLIASISEMAAINTQFQFDGRKHRQADALPKLEGGR